MPCDMVGQPHFESALFTDLLQLLVATAIARNRKNTVIPCYAFVFSIIRLGTSKQPDIGIGVGLRLRVMIHRLPSKNVCRLSVVRFFTSAYDKPVKIEKIKRSRTSS